jgi:hypothetical protein
MTGEYPCPECERKFGSEDALNSHVGHIHPSLVTETVECDFCGDEFTGRVKENRKYCSRSCNASVMRQQHCTFRFETADGYPTWWSGGYQATVHALAAVASGADPHKVYGKNKYHVDHINGCKLDNRPENLQVIDWHEHGTKSRPLNTISNRINCLRIVDNFIAETDMSILEALEVADID